MTLLDDATTPPMLLLWGYFAYFIVTIAYELAAATAPLVANACVVAVVVGVALNASAMGAEDLAAYARASPFRVLRFFLIPFCVSLFSSVVAASEGEFVSVFPRDATRCAATLGIAAAWPGACLAVARCRRRGDARHAPLLSAPDGASHVN